MNIYQKIAKLRYEVSAANLKKSGNNKFAGYMYYELADFMPLVTKLENELGLLSTFSLKDNIGVLEVVNAEKPEEKIIFTVNSAEANMKGMLEIQKIGAETTYVKRYVYINYTNLTESDSVDRQDVKPDKTKEVFDGAAKIAEISDLLGNDESKIEQWLKHFNVTAQNITLEVADNIIARIKTKQQNA